MAYLKGHGIKSLSTGMIVLSQPNTNAGYWLDKLSYMNDRNPYNLRHNLRFEIVPVTFNRHGVAEANR